jgi:hypothetical protein
LKPHEKWITTKPYQIVGTLPEGLPGHNMDSKAYAVNINNVRADVSRFSLDTQGFQWIVHHSEETLDTEKSIDAYLEEMENFVKSVLNAKAAKSYQYQV